jgi:hypothetical protein
MKPIANLSAAAIAVRNSNQRFWSEQHGYKEQD